MEQSNPHSLASALGVKESDVLEILLLFGIVKKHGQTLRVSKDVECWKGENGELKDFFGDNNVINESLSKCTGTSKKELFVRLGPYENGSKIKPPKEQKLDDVKRNYEKN
jgi:hypothetical protein